MARASGHGIVPEALTIARLAQSNQQISAKAFGSSSMCISSRSGAAARPNLAEAKQNNRDHSEDHKVPDIQDVRHVRTIFLFAISDSGQSG
jgi:hypothetical protein